jgi:mannose-1-phosphate guanylyltransferase
MKKRFRALLLAAGLGTRLRPITLHTPKCLVPIAGKPLLEQWLMRLECAGCEAVLVNTHHLADQVEAFVHNWQSPSMVVTTINERQLLGTAGTLLANRSFFKGTTGMLIHADNAMAEGLDSLLNAHDKRAEGCVLTMLTFKTDAPSSCGIVETDAQGVVTAFHEKVQEPPSKIANGAVYTFNSDFMNEIERLDPKPIDFSNDIIPNFMRRIQSFQTKKAFIDIGTPPALAKAQLIDFQMK